MDNNKKMDLMGLMEAIIGGADMKKAKEEVKRQAREEIKKEVAEGKHTIATREAQREVSLLIGTHIGTKLNEDFDKIAKILENDNVALASSLIFALCGVMASIMPSNSTGTIIGDIEGLKSIIELRRELLEVEVNIK